MTTCLVTGGSGFVGKLLCKNLVAHGYKVLSLSRRPVPELESIGVTCLQADLRHPFSDLMKHFELVDVIFHTAAKVDMWGKYEDFYLTNVAGTRRLLYCAKKIGIPHFIYTSSPSVIACGQDLQGVDESHPYPDRYQAFYPRTKAQAEQEVLRMHCEKTVRSLALRPHLIFGPGDTHLVPTIINRYDQGRLRQIGNGENLTDITYIDNCVAAHIQAFHALQKDPSIGGRAYFISQGEPIKLWNWINRILEAHNRGPVKRTVPYWLAYRIAAASEFLSSSGIIPKPPLFTRFLVSQMATSHYFDISAAKKQLGYQPVVSTDEAFDNLQSLAYQKAA